MAKPPKKTPRPSSAQTPTTSTHPSPAAENKRHLDRYLSQVEVAHLVGGVQRLSADTQTLFIVREG